jgi:hypothetical protein
MPGFDVEWFDRAAEQLASRAFAKRAGQIQALLDSVLLSEKGKDVSSVKATLERRWTQEN